MPSSEKRGWKRESGESPERSGHCDRGAISRYPIVCKAFVFPAVRTGGKRRAGQYEKGIESDDSGARKPALYGEVKLPCKV